MVPLTGMICAKLKSDHGQFDHSVCINISKECEVKPVSKAAVLQIRRRITG